MAEQEDSDFGYRFTTAIRESRFRDMTQSEIAKEFGVTQTTISTWRLGKKIPHAIDGIQICKRLNVCLEWLYTGRGSFRPSPEKNDPISELSRMIAHLRPSHIDIVMALVKQLSVLDK